VCLAGGSAGAAVFVAAMFAGMAIQARLERSRATARALGAGDSAR
jgi:hypothetical protein